MQTVPLLSFCGPTEVKKNTHLGRTCKIHQLNITISESSCCFVFNVTKLSFKQLPTLLSVSSNILNSWYYLCIAISCHFLDLTLDIFFPQEFSFFKYRDPALWFYSILFFSCLSLFYTVLFFLFIFFLTESSTRAETQSCSHEYS